VHIQGFEQVPENISAPSLFMVLNDIFILAELALSADVWMVCHR
jgi:hypothetical protein